jgi:hypothetical protein
MDLAVPLALQDGTTGLYTAALNGHKDVGQLLLENNANVNASTTVQTSTYRPLIFCNESL